MTFRNRVWVSPMCQYSANSDGLADSWHLVHLGQFAVGGAGLVITEATAVTPEGRISPFDTGLWADQHIEAWKPIVRFIQEQGARAGIQLAHSGRKGSTAPPWVRQTYVTPADGGWTTVAPSEVAFGTLPTPAALHRDGIADLIDCSSGGNAPDAKIPLAPGYQVGFAERVRGEASIRTGTVGLIEHPQQAEGILADGAADAIFLGRAMLREPHWALLAANTLGVELDWAVQYARGKT